MVARRGAVPLETRRYPIGMIDSPLISIVIPEINEADRIPRLYQELTKVCDSLPYTFQFVIVDDGSTDQSPEILKQLHEQDQRVNYLLFSRNFGHQAALSAGLEYSSGDAAITMDCDLQHPPEMIPELLKLWKQGFDVVNTVRVTTESSTPTKELLSRGFYAVFNWLANVRIEPAAADFRLMSRPVVDVLNRLPEKHRFFRGLVPWVGFRQAQIPFAAQARRGGAPKYTLLRSLRLALNGLTSFSLYPLRRLAITGAALMSVSFLYGLWAIAAHIFGYGTVPGWTSLVVCVLLLGGCQLLALGVIAEYIGRILEQVQGRPAYIIREAALTPHAVPPESLASTMTAVNCRYEGSSRDRTSFAGYEAPNGSTI
jgi:dolichol-phosphate mannosyltransferase